MDTKKWHVTASDGHGSRRLTSDPVPSGLASVIAWNWLQGGYAVRVSGEGLPPMEVVRGDLAEARGIIGINRAGG